MRTAAASTRSPHIGLDGAYEEAFSPSGKRIAFDSNLDGDDEIYLMRADGTHRHQITQNPADDGRPVWQSLPRRRQHR